MQTSAQETLAFINGAFDAGRDVIVCSGPKGHRYTPNDRSLFKLNDSGYLMLKGQFLATPTARMATIQIA